MQLFRGFEYDFNTQLKIYSAVATKKQNWSKFPILPQAGGNLNDGNSKIFYKKPGKFQTW